MNKYVALLTIDSACLPRSARGCADVDVMMRTVVDDCGHSELVGDPMWSAITDVRVDGEDVEDVEFRAQDAADTLLRGAGWIPASDWEATPTGYETQVVKVYDELATTQPRASA